MRVNTVHLTSLNSSLRAQLLLTASRTFKTLQPDYSPSQIHSLTSPPGSIKLLGFTSKFSPPLTQYSMVRSYSMYLIYYPYPTHRLALRSNGQGLLSVPSHTPLNCAMLCLHSYALQILCTCWLISHCFKLCIFSCVCYLRWSNRIPLHVELPPCKALSDLGLWNAFYKYILLEQAFTKYSTSLIKLEKTPWIPL